MMKTVLAVASAAAVLSTVTLSTPAKAQVDMQGRHFDDRDPAAFYGKRGRGYDATVDASRLNDHAPTAPLRPKRRATKSR
jgi:hypothetical protein